MKKLVILLIVLTTVLSFSAIAQTQTSVTIGNESGAVGSNVHVPIDVNFTNVGSFDFYIDFDAANLTFVGVANLASGVAVSYSTPDPMNPNRLYIQRVSLTPINITNDKLLDLVFTSNALGVYPLVFFVLPGTPESPIPSNSSVVNDAQGNQILDTDWTPGTVEFVAAVTPVPLSNWAIFIGLGLIIAFLVVRFRRIV